ncbi:MAG: nucleotidyltransferase domain-containing protein [Nitrospira sp.]|nr:nucleotidyltransferase domain-containing protein [Nitrospira sp.]TKB64326.1 MAG: nucleotidyltransferase domain-containing protein [Nitrospira sp.]
MARNFVEIETVASRTLTLLKERIPVTQAYIFGSHVEGVPDENSDIDIAAFSPAADAMDAATRVALIVDVERQVGASVELHLYGASQYAEARPTNFFGYLLTHGKPIR